MVLNALVISPSRHGARTHLRPAFAQHPPRTDISKLPSDLAAASKAALILFVVTTLRSFPLRVWRI